MSLVLDAGAFLAVERADRRIVALMKGELVAGRAPVTHGGVIGQVWRGGSGRQAQLGWLFKAVNVVPLDAELGRRAGVLLGSAAAADVIDAAVVLLASDGDTILTSDAGDLEPLTRVAAVHVDLVNV